MLANKKVFSKNRTFLRLSWSENPAEIISYIFKRKTSIFWVPMYIPLIIKPSFVAQHSYYLSDTICPQVVDTIYLQVVGITYSGKRKSNQNKILRSILLIILM